MLSVGRSQKEDALEGWDVSVENRQGTFVFKEIAHFRASGQNKLGDIFDDFGLLSG